MKTNFTTIIFLVKVDCRAILDGTNDCTSGLVLQENNEPVQLRKVIVATTSNAFMLVL